MAKKSKTPESKETFLEVELLKFARKKYKNYGLAVLEDRAFPDFRDGLNPVNRRILFSAYELGIRSNAKHVKSARIVGDCFAKGTLVTLATHDTIPIESLVIGDEVLTDTGVEAVTQLYELPAKTLYEVVTDNGVVQATEDQIFFCLDQNGLEVERTPLTLKPGDRIKTCR